MIMRPTIFMMIPALILLLLVVIAVTVIFIKLCSKRPWLAAITALLIIPLLAVIFLSVSHPRIVVNRTPHYEVMPIPEATAQSEDTDAAIWLPGIEDQFEANVHPSKLSAVRSLGLQIGEPVREVFGETSPSGLVLFQGAHDRGLIEEFARATARAFPDTPWKIAPETAPVLKDEVGIRIDIVKVQTNPAPWSNGSGNEMSNGTIQASVLAGDRQANIRADFVDKPWVEDFSAFFNTTPNSQFIIAKSAESCMTEAEANRQAMQNACSQVADMIGQIPPRRSGVPVSFAKPVNSADILEGSFILDRFVQSFEGAAGKIWRQALLVDASAEKLKKLAQRKAVIARARKRGFTGMFFSIVGLILLITVVYAFLNAATKGY
ncbi:MAG TPA: hypothetical protein DIU00_11775, partial [Phycisphaerales bacterium]|nr:hypothetical protein [Phycisphaerales bacterium]